MSSMRDHFYYVDRVIDVHVHVGYEAEDIEQRPGCKEDWNHAAPILMQALLKTIGDSGLKLDHLIQRMDEASVSHAIILSVDVEIKRSNFLINLCISIPGIFFVIFEFMTPGSNMYFSDYEKQNGFWRFTKDMSPMHMT